MLDGLSGLARPMLEGDPRLAPTGFATSEAERRASLGVLSKASGGLLTRGTDGSEDEEAKSESVMLAMTAAGHAWERACGRFGRRAEVNSASE